MKLPVILILSYFVFILDCAPVRKPQAVYPHIRANIGLSSIASRSSLTLSEKEKIISLRYGSGLDAAQIVSRLNHKITKQTLVYFLTQYELMTGVCGTSTEINTKRAPNRRLVTLVPSIIDKYLSKENKNSRKTFVEISEELKISVANVMKVITLWKKSNGMEERVIDPKEVTEEDKTEIVRLRETKGMTFPEIAKELNMSVDTARGMYWRHKNGSKSQGKKRKKSAISNNKKIKSVKKEDITYANAVPSYSGEDNELNEFMDLLLTTNKFDLSESNGSSEENQQKNLKMESNPSYSSFTLFQDPQGCESIEVPSDETNPVEPSFPCHDHDQIEYFTLLNMDEDELALLDSLLDDDKKEEDSFASPDIYTNPQIQEITNKFMEIHNELKDKHSDDHADVSAVSETPDELPQISGEDAVPSTSYTLLYSDLHSAAYNNWLWWNQASAYNAWLYQSNGYTLYFPYYWRQ